jgi:ABC-type sugar transport system permease subunit
MRESRIVSLLLVAPALATLLAFFVTPLGYSLITAFVAEDGALTTAHFVKAFEFYSRDIWFTVVIVGLSTVLIATIAVAILKWLYRWPLFIPFIVAGQMMRSFLAKNGLMNNTFVSLGLLDPLETTSFLDWQGLIITFVW